MIVFLPLLGLLGSFAVMGVFTSIAWLTLPPEWQFASLRMFSDPRILLELDPLPEQYLRVMSVIGWIPLTKALIVFSLCYQAALDRLQADAPPVVDAAFVRSMAHLPDETAQKSITDIIEGYTSDR